ncbi:MAG: UDP-N-acetylmuramate dehydrogenase, partial [Bacteroidales bacterium]|nr:UDP-N-acetylmuramate dehydrogenase [Bacteroidales bacterium]
MKRFPDFSLKSHNTFAVDAQCDSFVVLESADDVKKAVDEGCFAGKFFILGGGSNILFTSDFHGTVIHPAFSGISLIDETDKSVRVEVAAGEKWEDLVSYAVANGYYGIENLTGIPGNVGSCPVQNIGAYGVEVKDVIAEVRAVKLDTGEKVTFSNPECCFGYRDSIFKKALKNKVLITSVVFEFSKVKNFTLTYTPLKNALQNCSELSLSKVVETVQSVRNAKLPQVGKVGSAGSFFKNPVLPAESVVKLQQTYPELQTYNVDKQFVKLSAAQLIDLAGCKLWRDGDVAVFPSQPLVIVNYGNATGGEVVRFYEKVQRAVADKF